MELIPSFSVDHTKIVPGIFVSRQDEINGNIITTYDVRLKRPNREPVMDVAAMHSLEHIIATYLRNEPNWKQDVIYWGPMGCLTGFYLILKGNRKSQEVYDLLLAAFKSVADCDLVPGTTAENCGYYLMHNLGMAKWFAKEFEDYLVANAGKSEIFEYPKTDRLVTDKGQQFFDS
ncbi:S-ribosylhomocysteine lyase /quorum-sensing autoinducer 2 (AI-2) synthesis protein LuxS [Acetitomaculum ruminis DSM 5522]|uniref:S-ribosylhomocysteine lyase n=1 Tax=Acetitomaculum ruminis DSM 5522 TaxID=1120918 RepID=A0A1I1AS51_9FIRM|nr:S-ribosylhomocysteine lyase [Acetitomaculum ruminis]SFB39308.1 S-ribosylhomocysteine lyase /quorum-sensing autoinducer 2 (AI-2) synthesis protein LuxS [Acetitomaculum ruminis DSM 5522]